MTRDFKIALAVWVVSTVVFAATTGQRLLRHSTDTHFVYQAECFLKGRLDLGGPPPHANDWAEVETLQLASGRTLRGQFLRANPLKFRTLSGRTEEIPASDIASRSKKYYVSFPPFPALLLLPFVAVFHHQTNDTLFSVVLAGLCPALLYFLLRRLPNIVGDLDPASERSDGWLVAFFGFGTVFFFSAVQGQVWYTAHMVASVLCLLYLLCLWPLRPFACGFLCGALFLTRPQMASVGLLFLLEVGRHALKTILAQPDKTPWRLVARRALPPLLWFALPAVVLAGAGMAFNLLRFERPLEFGHTYLQTLQADNIQRFGLMNYQFLPRNLAAALTLLPKLLPTYPYVQISHHGLALWFTSPALLFLLWPKRPLFSRDVQQIINERERLLRRALLLCIVPISLASLLYQNTGYVQFGYRFSLDSLPLLMVLLRLGSPDLSSSLLFRFAVVFGIVVNSFGAVTFNRMPMFYFNGFFPVN